MSCSPQNFVGYWDCDTRSCGNKALWTQDICIITWL